MQIKLTYYDLMEAVEKKLNETFEGSIYLDDCETYLHVEISEPDRQPKKHKNGRIVKNEHGYPIYETVGTKKHNLSFNDDSYLSISIYK
tara:strand:- start:621 stop:887 length:267 start_codon:yes stop_codon:yes gene_type:complete